MLRSLSSRASDLEVGVAIPVGCLVPLAIALAVVVGAGVVVGTRMSASSWPDHVKSA